MLATALAQASAHRYDGPNPDDYENEAPPEDTPVNNTASNRVDSLRFPLKDRTGDPQQDPAYRGMDLNDPANLQRNVEYDPEENRYYFTEKIGETNYRNPTYLTYEEYSKYRAQQDENSYWHQRLNMLSMMSRKPEMPTMMKDGIFDRIFGGNTINVRPQGNVDVTLGGNWQNIKNPTLVQRAQKYGIFDFDMQMNINLLATIGDKLKLNISNNTKATFDYQNIQKLEYTGKEDEILKKIEAGNTSFPLRSTLISGVQSLFGIKTQLQFGKLWVTGVISQQKSKRNSITLQGGAQTQSFRIKSDDYDENRHFLLAQYFRDNYDAALKDFPVIRSLVTINKIEVWITNRNGTTEGVRDILAFQDLGEAKPFSPQFLTGGSDAFPNNRRNSLYEEILQRPNSRSQANATLAAQSLGLVQSQDFERTTARKLTPSEFSYNSQLGYISLNTQVNTDDILAVAYRYTVNGQNFQIGEFAEDLPPDSTNQKILFLKLLKGQSLKPALPVWDLMMKNVYSLGGLGLSKEDFVLNVLYQDPGGGEKRYIPDGPSAGIPLLTLLNLDRLNFQNDPQPDGRFDYVEGVTVNTQQGKIIFPVLEPFGSDLKPAFGGNTQLERKYLYQILYDSTKTIARQQQQNNRFLLSGTYKSSSSSEIFLGGFNIPPGSVSVTAGGQKLIENSDYQIDYGLGRIRILNAGVLSSGIPINVQYEDNATFGFQQQNFMGARFDYYSNEKLTLGGTIMRLTERPFTQKTSFGEDPIKNTVIGLDVNYQSEVPGLTRLLDKLPLFSTTAPSFLSTSAEVATIRPGHSKLINALDPEGSVYIDDFEGTRSNYDLKFPAAAWTLASTPVGAKNAAGTTLFPEASDNNMLSYGKNRARLAWYILEPNLVDPPGGIPDYIKKDPAQHYVRLVQQQDVFPQKTYATLQNALSTLDLTFFPQDRGPYNFDATALDINGKLKNPETRWGGIMRPIETSDFEAANVEYVEFWIMDPFIGNPGSQGGSLFLNLGNVSEDVLKDSRKFFENGIPYPKVPANLDQSIWGFVPRFQQQITRAFDNDPAARASQDVGYDGLSDDEEATRFADYVSAVPASIRQEVAADPSGDNYKYYRDEFPPLTGVRSRYKFFNNPHGNSPIADASATYSNAATTIPESEDINRDNTLNESEDYYQYRLDMKPGMDVGSNYIVNKQVSNVKLPNGSTEAETWFQFKIPIREYTNKVGNIADFRNIRFMRLFMSGFQDSVTMRFAQLNLGRNLWRQYLSSLKSPGENIPPSELDRVDFTVTSVSLEENSQREPVRYFIPPGVNRQQSVQGNNQSIQLNEQALSLQVCGLDDGNARAAFKEVTVDMRQFSNLRMFIHGESVVGKAPLKDGDIRAFIRIGSDFINNYYEYQIPLEITPPGAGTAEAVWPERNNLDVKLDDLVAVKSERNLAGLASFVPYSSVDSKGNTIVVVGNPNVGEAKTIMLGVLNPKQGPGSPGDDGLDKCTEVWFNEMRLTSPNEKPGYAATGKVDLQLADLGSVHLGGTMHTQGYGNIDQKLNQRLRDNYTQYEATTNINAGKLLPKNWGVQLPVYFGRSQSVSNPQYNPYDLDVKFKEQIAGVNNQNQKDSLKKAAQDFTSITSFNVQNMRITGNPEKANPKPMPWSLKNFDFSYSYNNQFKRNPLIEGDKLSTQNLNIGYTYNIRGKPVEPFKRVIKSKSKWLAPIKDLNLNLLPSNFTFRNIMNRVMDENQVRNIGDGPYKIEPTFYKNFIWTRSYALRWELTRSLSFNYDALNTSRIDEPYGKIDNGSKRDSLWDAIKTLGRNTNYTQNLTASYNVPLSKIPILDWTNLRLTYTSGYNWTAASRLAQDLGNTIGNTQAKNVTGDFNFSQLYNKQRWLRAVNQPKTVNARNKKNATPEDPRAAKPKPKMPGRQGEKENPGEDTEPTPGQPSASEEVSAPKEEPVSKEPAKLPDVITINGTNIVTANMSNQQIDSLKKLQKASVLARSKAEKAKKKAARKLARKQRKATTPFVTDGERIAGRLLTMVKRGTFNFREQSGTILPGYLDSTRILGVNTNNLAPGPGFAFGSQPGYGYLDEQAAERRLSRDSIFNGQFAQTYSQTFNLTATVEPIPNDLRIDLTLTKTFSKNHSELYKDTDPNRPGFEHNNPFETGTFNISYIALKTMFKGSGINGPTYQNFMAYRRDISNRLGGINPYTNNVADPNDPNYKKGYTEYSQDVLIPAFVAAYSGKKSDDASLISYENSNVRSNPFRNFFPMPNWKLTFTGLSKLPFIKDRVSNLVFNHGYTGSLSMNSFANSLYYQDDFLLGYPSFIDSNSGNYVPFFQVPNMTITEQFGPLAGLDLALKNGLTARFEYRKSRTVSLSLVDYQVSETNSSELVIGAGYRKHGLKLPFPIFGLTKLENDINMKLDIGIRDDKSINTYLAQNESIITRGQRVVSISPSIDYIVSDRLTLRFFYDRRQSIPYISSSYPITTTKAGVTLRFIFAQ